MRDFDYQIIYGFTSKNLIWIRIRYIRWGIEIDKNPLPSGRNIKRRRLKIFGWYFSFLKAKWGT